MLSDADLEDRALQCERLAALYPAEPAARQLRTLAGEFRGQMGFRRIAAAPPAQAPRLRVHK